MTRLFMHCAGPEHVDVVAELQSRGFEIPLLYVVEYPGVIEKYRAVAPQAEIVCNFEIMSGRLPLDSLAQPEPVPADLMAALSQDEATAIQLIDRRNFGNQLSVQDLRFYYLRYISVWKALLDLHRPDVMVFHISPHQGHDYVLGQLCRYLGIRVLIVERTFIQERMFIREGLDDLIRPSREEIEAEVDRQNSVHDSPLSISKPLPSANAELEELRMIRSNLGWRTLARLIIGRELLSSHWRRVKSTAHGLSQAKPLRIQLRWQELRGRLQIRKLLWAFEQAVETPDWNANFVYLPLHYQPERTTVPDGSPFGDQHNVAHLLAASLPDGWRLYIKEHRRQFRRGLIWNKGRSLDFYDRLRCHPRVTLVPLETPSEKLMAQCRAVATITGTAGWEAVQAGTPAIVFGQPWYLHCPGVHRVASVPECTKILNEIAAGSHVVDNRLVLAYIRLLREKYTFRGVTRTRLPQGTEPTVQENVAAYATAIERACLREQLISVSSV